MKRSCLGRHRERSSFEASCCSLHELRKSFRRSAPLQYSERTTKFLTLRGRSGYLRKSATGWLRVGCTPPSLGAKILLSADYGELSPQICRHVGLSRKDLLSMNLEREIGRSETPTIPRTGTNRHIKDDRHSELVPTGYT
jgi:hypothetical protein